MCHRVLGQAQGACNDELLGGINSAQLSSANKRDGVTEIIYRKTFGNLGDAGDIPISEDDPTSIIWAIGNQSFFFIIFILSFSISQVKWLRCLTE